eukprot:CAMPEP_0114561120 /NCGR_PEP_ID=MMETSP0114-20121206/11833_1 /TAXON_ID=31324 /ORGANISM="Goniomonas sp, Strain m" /LENGTH=443 /DNA_ID=CAMNT_0001746731 /DNA_START=105 /DNA_END=1436 /DNA_ORIENTATION=+
MSPGFDKDWATNGLQEQAVDCLIDWVQAQKVPTLSHEVVRLEGRTPLIFLECPATKPDSKTCLMYGHLDKQPPFEGWEPGLAPYEPVMREGKLYGRGGADDGYAIFAAVGAIKRLKEQNTPHGRFVIIIEACEESGSFDLPAYVDFLKERIGSPNFIVCLDSGAGNYENMWITTSLRGMVAGELSVKILTEGVHSGDASGIVPSSFRIIRTLLSRIEDETTGEIKLPELHAEIPKLQEEQIRSAANELGAPMYQRFPFVPGGLPTGGANPDVGELALRRTWRPALSVTGAAGLPPLPVAGNVLRPETALKLSMRLPPTVDPILAAATMKRVLEADPPYGATVTFNAEKRGAGWVPPTLAPWLSEATMKASQAVYGKPCRFTGEGGSIPFMGMLGQKFPEAQFLVVGVLGPSSNAHGPNEFLHVPFAKRLCACVALVLADHANT